MTLKEYFAIKTCIHILENSEHARKNIIVYDSDTEMFLPTLEILTIFEEYLLKILEEEEIK